jgi:hypothetical protein
VGTPLRSLLAAILGGAVALGAASAQRCGDHLYLSLLDDHGKPILPGELTKITVHVTVRDINHREELQSYDPVPDTRELPEGRTVSAIRTDCGLEEARFDIEWHGRRMEIAIRHVRGDAGNILLRDAAFAAGAFIIDLGGGLEETCILVHGTQVEGIQIINERLWSIRRDRVVRVTAIPNL